MKKYEFELDGTILKLFFPNFRVKNKIHILEILLEATRYLLIKPISSISVNSNKLVLLVDKMSRLIFLNDKKQFSIVFPFNVYEENSNLNFTFYDITIDSQLVSNVMSILKNDNFNSSSCLDFVDPIDTHQNEYNDGFWTVLRELLMFEDGYIRYENDEEGYRLALAKGEPNKHPIHHYDIFFSNKATFKIGLQSEINQIDFIDFLDVKTDCKFIS